MFRVYKKPLSTRIVDRIERNEATWSKAKVGISKNFRDYVQNTVPELERPVEIRILNKIYNDLKSPALKEELLNSFHRRSLDSIYGIEKQVIYTDELPLTREKPNVWFDIYADSMKELDYRNLGKFFKYSLRDFIKYFPHGNFGCSTWFDKVMVRSFDFSVFMGSLSFQIIQHLKAINQSFDISMMSNQNFLEKAALVKTREDLDLFVYKNVSMYRQLHFELSATFRNVMAGFRHDPILRHFCEMSFLSQSIVCAILWEMHRPEVREAFSAEKQYETIKRLLNQIKRHKDVQFFVQNNPDSFFEHFGEFRVSPEVTIDFRELKDWWKRRPSSMSKLELGSFAGLSTDMLLWGRQGCGKSGVLFAVTMWAHQNGWFVVKLPSVRALTHSKWTVRRDENSRLYLSEEFAVKMLKDIKQNNFHLLKVHVKAHLYGEYNMSGVHNDEPNPVPNFYMEDRQTYFYESDRFLSEQELIEINKHKEDTNYRLSDRLPSPRNLLEIVNFGIEHPLLAVNAVAELLEQLYNGTHPLLVVVDDYNWFFRPSDYRSFRYADLTGSNSTVPAYHLALARLFMKFDGHRIRNGFKLAASSNYPEIRHFFSPEKINFPRPFAVEMKGLEQKFAKNFWYYCYSNKIDITGEKDPEYATLSWMENQGNFGEMIKIWQTPDKRYEEGL